MKGTHRGSLEDSAGAAEKGQDQGRGGGVCARTGMSLFPLGLCTCTQEECALRGIPLSALA